MIDFLKSITIRKYWILQVILSKNNYLKTSGWTTSFKSKKSVNASGAPIPWFTLPAIDFIDSRLHGDISVLEYGSGNSTLYFCRKCAKVTTIEDNTEWYNYVKSNIPGNGHIVNSTISDYPIQLKLLGLKPDIIIIDGKLRQECITELRNYHQKPSIIILDDSERKAYHNSIHNLKSDGYKSIEFWGIAPGLFYKKCTTIFYQKQNCLDI